MMALQCPAWSRTYKYPGEAIKDIYADLNPLTFLKAVLSIRMRSDKMLMAH